MSFYGAGNSNRELPVLGLKYGSIALRRDVNVG